VDSEVYISLGNDELVADICSTIPGYGLSQRIGDSAHNVAISGTLGFIHSDTFDIDEDPPGPALCTVAVVHDTAAVGTATVVSDVFAGVDYNGNLGLVSFAGQNLANSERFTVLWRHDFCYNPLSTIKKRDIGTAPTINGVTVGFPPLDFAVELTDSSKWQSLGYGTENLRLMKFDVPLDFLPPSYFRGNDCMSGCFRLVYFSTSVSSNTTTNVPTALAGSVRLRFRSDERESRADIERWLGTKFAKFQD